MSARRVVFGAGRLGRSLGAALAVRGDQVQMWSRGGGPAPLAEGDTAVLAVPDDALAGFAEGLAAGDWTGRRVIHCSGRAGVEPLAPLAARGAVAAAAHPVMTFTGDPEIDLPRLPGIGWGVTAADPAGLAAGFAFAETLGGRPFEVADAGRALYHAALAHAINHLGVVAVEAARLAALAGVPDAAVLRPAMEAALAGALEQGTAAATGPVVRGDAGTLAAHARAIRDADPGAWAPYAALARAGVAQALAAGRIDGFQAERLLSALKG